MAKKDDLFQMIGSLLHCAHADQRVEVGTASLLYAGLRAAQAALQQDGDWQQFNATAWSLRERIRLGSIRIVKRDPIHGPARRTPLTRSVLAVPNTTTLDSSSSSLSAAREMFGWDAAGSQGGTALGSTVVVTPKKRDIYDMIVQLICRMPGDPHPKMLSESLSAVPIMEEPTYVSVPLFGGDNSWAEWRDALLVWHARSQQLQRSHMFLDVCYTEKSQSLAEHVRSSLSECGVEVAMLTSE